MTAVSTMIAGSPPWADFAFSGLPAGTAVCRILRQDPDGRWVLLPGSSQRPILGSEWRFIDHGFPVSVDPRTVQYRLEPLSVAGAVLPSPPTVVRSYELAADGSSVEEDGAGTILRRNYAKNASAEVDVTGWAFSAPGGGSAQATSEAAWAGSKSVKVTATAVGVAYLATSFSVAPHPGGVLTASVRIKPGPGTTYRTAGSRITGQFYLTAGGSAVEVPVTVTALPGGWEQVSATFTPASAVSRFMVLCYPDTASPAAPSFYLDAAQLETGTEVRPYFDSTFPTVYGPSQQTGLPFAAQAASVGHSQAWLSDPLDPLAAVLVDVMEEGRQAQWGGAGGGLFPPVGGRPPVSSGFRRWRQRDWAVTVDAPDSAARILGMIEDGGVLLLRGDPDCLVHPTGVVYINADSPELSWMLPHDPHRRYTIGGVECAPPAILQVVASRTYADDLAEHPTHAASKAAYSTYLARVRG